MKISEINIPKELKTLLVDEGFINTYPTQTRAIKSGLLSGKI